MGGAVEGACRAEGIAEVSTPVVACPVCGKSRRALAGATSAVHLRCRLPPEQVEALATRILSSPSLTYHALAAELGVSVTGLRQLIQSAARRMDARARAERERQNAARKRS